VRIEQGRQRIPTCTIVFARTIVEAGRVVWDKNGAEEAQSLRGKERCCIRSLS
jgi:hypothetical protein